MTVQRAVSPLSKPSSNLGVAIYRQQRFDEAEPCFREALQVRERTLDPDHPHMARSFNALGALLILRQRPEDALPLLERSARHNDLSDAAEARRQAAAIRRVHDGETSQSYARSLNQLADVLFEAGKLEEAEAIFKQTEPLYDQNLDPDHPSRENSRLGLGAVAWKRRDLARAEMLNSRGLSHREAHYGPDHAALLSPCGSRRESIATGVI